VNTIRLAVLETADATHIQLEVSYDKGGMNWYTGREEPNGIYIHVRPTASRDGCTSFVLGKGYKRLLETAPRLNRKRLAQLTDDIRAQIAARSGIAWSMVHTVAAADKLVLVEAEPV
jgi:hypothetical protein